MAKIGEDLRKKGFLSSWDDGKSDDRQLAELLRRYKIPAIFYLPTACDLDEEDIIDLSKDFEIGGHTTSHALLTRIDEEDAWQEIIENKRYLEQVIGKEITSFAYPRGYYTQNIKKLVKKAGYREARGVEVFETKTPKDKFAMKTTIHCSYPRKEYKGMKWLDLAKKILDKKPAYFHLWGHSSELEEHKYWGDLEEFFRYIRKPKTKTYKKVKGRKYLTIEQANEENLSTRK